jgi:hypothetical protein
MSIEPRMTQMRADVRRSDRAGELLAWARHQTSLKGVRAQRTATLIPLRLCERFSLDLRRIRQHGQICDDPHASALSVACLRSKN